MKRLVYAEDVKEQIDEWLDAVGTAYVGKGLSYYGELLGCIEDAPTVEAEPVVHGMWIEKEDAMVDTYYDCSVCGESFTTIDGTPSDNLFNYCPNCGAKMDGGVKNE